MTKNDEKRTSRLVSIVGLLVIGGVARQALKTWRKKK